MELFIKNALRLAHLGLGDGTVYASAIGATPVQVGKTFVLTGFSWITDVGADSDDKANSHILYFPASDNRYLIVDWVAGTDTATVERTPDLADIGACEIRRALVDVKALAANPVKNMADGQRFQDWKSAANAVIEVYLENAVTNGGFESPDILPWVKTEVGGIADVTGINTTAPMIGTQDLQLDRGDRTSVKVSQTFRDLKKDRTYRLLFKALHTGTFAADQFEAKLVGTGLDVTLSVPSTGTVSGTAFRPILTTSEVWYTVDITTPKWDVVGASLELNITGAFDVFIDEVYIHEKVAVDSLLTFDHTVPFSLTKVVGRNCAKDRTNQTAGVDDVTLTGAATVTGGDVGIVEFTAGVHPIYTIESTDLIQASEILLAEKWAWQFNPDPPFALESKEYDETTQRSRSGVERIARHSETRLLGPGIYSQIPAVDRDILMNSFFPHHIDSERHPFGYRFDPQDRPLLAKVDTTRFRLTRNFGVLDDWEFEFKEVV